MSDAKLRVVEALVLDDGRPAGYLHTRKPTVEEVIEHLKAKEAVEYTEFDHGDYIDMRIWFNFENLGGI